MKKKILRIVGVAVTLVIVCSLAVALAPAAPANEVSADPAYNKWARFSTPRTGALTGYILTSSSNTTAGPGPVAKAIDGTIYAYWDINETDDLYKSTDNGRSWTRCSSSTDELPGVAIIDIAPSKEDADLLYVCSTTQVYRSSNGGSTFTAISTIPATVIDDADEVITSLDVGYDGNSHWIVVGTARSGALAYPDGEVYIKQDPYLGPWQEQNITDGRQVWDVACAPDFATASPLVLAVTANYSYVSRPFVQVEFQWSGGAWSRQASLLYNVTTTTTANITGNLTSADIQFPADFNSSFPSTDFFVGVSTTLLGGDVYHVYASTGYDRDIRAALTSTNIASVAVAGSCGDTMLLAGCTDRSDVFHSEDDGATWRDSKYDPSGNVFGTYVLVADDYYDSGVGWAFAGGYEGAMSQTSNYGISFYQISLINTNLKLSSLFRI